MVDDDDGKMTERPRAKVEQQKLAVIPKKEQEQIAEKVIINSLTIGQPLQRSVVLGNSDSLVRMVEKEKGRITAIYWCEEAIAVETDDMTKYIVFAPEFDASTGMFFSRDEKRNQNMFSDEVGMRIWEGEFEAVEFRKKDILAYLNKYAERFDKEVSDAVKNMKITKKHEVSEEMLNLDDTATRTIEDASETTNIPKKFKATMPIFDGIQAVLEFEVAVKEKEDRYASGKMTRVMHLRCLNARQVLRDTMEGILEKMPKDIPKYYGKYKMMKGGRN